MGRRKIEIQPITHERNRSVTFLKRKNGLFKKAYELGVLCSVDVAVIIFEERAGHHVKLHEYCSADVDNMVQRHLHFDGEKEFKGPSDFNNKPDAGDNDDEEEEEEDGGKRRGSSSVAKLGGIKPSSGRMLQGKQSGSMMGLDMDYRGSMALPQPPLGHLQIPSGAALSNPSPTSYPASSGIPVSLVRNTPNDGMPSAPKRQRLDSGAASAGGYGGGGGGENPYALHDVNVSSPSYGLSAGLFPSSGQQRTGGGGGGGNPASPTAHQFGFPQFSRAGSGSGGGGNSRSSFSGGGGGGNGGGGGGSASYGGNPPPMYNPSNPFASLIGANNAPSSASPHSHGHGGHGHGGHAHHAAAAPAFEPLDWPVHSASSSSSQQQQQQQQQQSAASDRGGPSSASPHPQSQSQQGFPPRPGATASGGGGAGGGQDTSWLDFLSSAAPPPGVVSGAGAGSGAGGGSRAGSATSVSGGGGGGGRRMEDSYERGMSGISAAAVQVQRSRSDSSVKEEGGGGGAARAGSVHSASEGGARPSANGSAGAGDTKDGLDLQGDVS